MSHDRVEFVIPLHRICKNLGEVLTRAFGITEHELNVMYGKMKFNYYDGVERTGETVKIVCRPSQFARFLICHNEAGISNSFKELEPKLIPGKPKSSNVIELDVWERIANDFD